MKKDNPFIYQQFIEEYYKAYKLIKKNGPSPVDFLFVKSFLLGRIIELILKTKLIIIGYSSSDLQRRNVGSHNLEKLIKLLNNSNKNDFDPIVYDAIIYLNNFYNLKRYEYPHEDDVGIKNTSFLEMYIKQSIKELDLKLNNNELKLNST